MGDIFSGFAWSDVMTQVSAFLAQDIVKGLIVALASIFIIGAVLVMWRRLTG